MYTLLHQVPHKWAKVKVQPKLVDEELFAVHDE
jgi:hypothetical protein